MLTADQKRVKSLVEVFNTPIVFEPGGWAETLPEWLRGRVIAERVDMVCNGGWDTATDAEVTCYLYTASLNHPLGSDWTEITLFEAAKQIPQLRQALDAVPEKLSQYQESELKDLKGKIRNSQLKRQKEKKKEVTMPKRKVVLDEREGGVLIGVMQEQCDPVTLTCEGTIEVALTRVPDLLKTAEEKWKTSPRNPAYKAPPAPVKPKATTPAATVPGSKTDELPLLKGKGKPETKETPAVVTPAPAGQAETEAKVEPATEAAGAPPETPAEVSPAVPTVEAERPAEPATEPAETKPPGTETIEVKPEAVPASTETTKPTAGEIVHAIHTNDEATLAAAGVGTPAPVAPAPAAATTGEVEYWLKDTRGPFKTVQEAMDAMGLEKANRPAHNRWDRLSTSLKDQIQRKPKAQ